MNRVLNRTIIAAAACVVVLAMSTTAKSQTRYRVTRIITAHGDAGLPRAINNHGQVTGSSGGAHGSDTAAFIAQPGGKGSQLASLPSGDYSEAFGINDVGEIVGSSNTASTLRATRWNGGSPAPLSLPAGRTASEAFAVNNSGTVAGYVSGAPGMQASLWANDGSVQLLGTISNGETSQATAVNTQGDAAGWTQKNGIARAFLWTAGTMNFLPGGSASRANGINDSQEVVGACTGPEGDRACLWGKDGLVQLGTLPGGDYAEAFDINNAETVVGSADTSLGLRAFVWTKSNGMQDLNSLIPPAAGVVISAAIAINEQGQIVAYGSTNHDLTQDRNVDLDHGVHAGPTFVFLLTPIP